MDAEDILKIVVIDAWYKVLLYLGAGVLAVSFFVDVKGGLTNQQLQLLSGGVFSIGLGEWKNHKVASWIKPPNAYTGGAALMSQKSRKADFVGVALDLAGLFLIGSPIVKIFRG